MQAFLNPYYEWLGIDPRAAQPNYYELLAIDQTLDDAQAIAAAADRAASRVRGFRPGEHAALWARLLDDIADAKQCLTDSSRRRAYDAWLASLPPRAAQVAAGPGSRAAAVAPTDPMAPMTATALPPLPSPPVSPPPVVPLPPIASPPIASPPIASPRMPSPVAPLVEGPAAILAERTFAPGGDGTRAWAVVERSQPTAAVLGGAMESLRTGEKSAAVVAPAAGRRGRFWGRSWIYVLGAVTVLPLIVHQFANQSDDSAEHAATRAAQVRPSSHPSHPTHASMPGGQDAAPARTEAAPQRTVPESLHTSMASATATADSVVPSISTTLVAGRMSEARPSPADRATPPAASSPAPATLAPNTSDSTNTVSEGKTAGKSPATMNSQEFAKLNRALDKAREAIGEHEFDLAREFLAAADELAQLAEHKAKVARLQTLQDCVQKYQAAIMNSVAKLQGGDSFPVGESTVALVEASRDRIMVRAAGRNRAFAYSQLPPGLAAALAALSLDTKDPHTLTLKGAYVLASPQAKREDLDKARGFLEEAAASDPIAQSLLPLFSDR